MQACVKRCHQQCGGKTLACDICHGDQYRSVSSDSWILAAKYVVVVARDRIRRAIEESNFESRNHRWRLRYKPALDFSRDLQIPLQRDSIGYLEQKKSKNDESAEQVQRARLDVDIRSKMQG